jgi:hypothetical protein
VIESATQGPRNCSEQQGLQLAKSNDQNQGQKQAEEAGPKPDKSLSAPHLAKTRRARIGAHTLSRKGSDRHSMAARVQLRSETQFVLKVSGFAADTPIDLNNDQQLLQLSRAMTSVLRTAIYFCGGVPGFTASPRTCVSC